MRLAHCFPLISFHPKYSSHITTIISRRMSAQDELKRRVAEAAITLVVPTLRPESYLGVGTGSTANFFIDLLAPHKAKFKAAISSSEATATRLKGHGIAVVDLNDISDPLEAYVDGADEFDSKLQLVKGGGGALTREKIVASASKKFICIVDESKRVEKIGKFPLPVEVIPMARELVARQIISLAGPNAKPVWRKPFVTDNGNHILDVHGLTLSPEDVAAFEQKLNNIVGVVTCGIFAMRSADVVLVGTKNGVETINKK